MNLPGPLVPVGLAEIAAICGKTRQAAVHWHHRSRQQPPATRHPLPEPDGTVSGQPCWYWRTVVPILDLAGWLPPGVAEIFGEDAYKPHAPGGEVQAFNSQGTTILTDLHGWVRVTDVTTTGDQVTTITGERLSHGGQRVELRVSSERWYRTTDEQPLRRRG